MLKINDSSQRLSAKNISEQRFQIQRYDKQLHENKPLENNGTIKPFAKGVLIHLGIIGVIILGNLTSNRGNSQPMVETSLITANELAGVKSQIAESRKQAKKSGKIGKSHVKPVTKPIVNRNNNNFTATPQNTPPKEAQTVIKKLTQSVTEIFAGKSKPTETEHAINVTEETKTLEKPKPSKEAIERQKKIAEREAEFKKTLEQFTKEEEEKARKARGEPEERRIMDEQELIEAFKKSEQKVENIVQEKKQTQAEIEQQRLEDLAMQEINKQILTEPQGEEGDGEGFEPVKKMSMGVPSSQRGSSNRKANTLQLVGLKIKRYLHPPTNSGGDRSEAKITVNARGEVIRVYVTGSNTYLNRAVEQAVKAASPLPITPNDRHYPIFSIGFDGQGNQ